MYSGRVKFISSIAGLCLIGALQHGCYVAWDFNSYVNEPEIIAKYRRPGEHSVLNFFASSLFRDRFLLLSFFFGTAIVLGGVTMHYARIERKVEQEQRDKIAKQLAAEIERRIAEIPSARTTPPFALYLRPFVLEKMIRRWKVGTSDYSIFFLETGKMNFDYFLQEHLNYLDIPLISIGFPDDQEGAGRVVSSDSAWRERFHQLAEQAKTIIVVPGIQAGILAEIRWLRVSGLLVNAVFFKPKGYPRADWQKMKEFYENEEDIEFPDYSPTQLSFRIYSSGRCYELLTWNTIYRRGVVKRTVDQMRALLANMSGKRD